MSIQVPNYWQHQQINRKKKNQRIKKKRKLEEVESQYEKLTELKENGWKNVTSQIIQLNSECQQATRFLISGNRSTVNPKSIFLRLFDPEILSMIANQMNAKAKSQSPDSVKSTTSFNSDDVLQYVAAIAECCGKQISEWKNYSRNQERKGLSNNRFESFRKYLSVRHDVLYSKFNENLKSVIHVGGHSCIDETILPYTGDSPYVVVIPRKPKDTGIRLYLWCFGLTSTNNPVVYHIIPDIVLPHFTGTQIVESMIQVIPSQYDATVTLDSFFVDLNFVQAQDHKIIASLSSNHEQAMMELFQQDLKHHEYRVFSNDKVTVTLFLDNKMMVTCTNAVSFSDPEEGIRHGCNVSTTKPRLSIKGAQILQQLDLDDLKSLSKSCGVPSSGTKEQIAFRIAGRIPPSHEPEIETNQETNENSLDSRVTELQKLKLEELKSLCLNYGIKYGSPSKKKLALRVAKHELQGKSDEIMKREISTFLNPTGRVVGDDKPFVTSLYSQSFNYNDRFNKLLSFISYKPRKTSEDMVLLIGLVEVALVQTWCLYRSESIGNEDEQSLKDFVKDLALSLLNDFN